MKPLLYTGDGVPARDRSKPMGIPARVLRALEDSSPGIGAEQHPLPWCIDAVEERSPHYLLLGRRMRA